MRTKRTDQICITLEYARNPFPYNAPSILDINIGSSHYVILICNPIFPSFFTPKTLEPFMEDVRYIP